MHLGVASGMIYLFHAGVLLANTIAFFTAFIFSYVFQTLYVFNSRFHVKRFLKFFLVQYGAFLLSYLLSSVVQLKNDYLHTLVIVIIIPIVGFIIHKFWTFKEF